MTHLDEGVVQAFLDDELPSAERSTVAEHLLACAECRAVRDDLGRAQALVSDTMALLDSGAPHGRREPARAPSRFPLGLSLARAAALVAVLAAAATAAVPGSPVRDWLFPVAEFEEPVHEQPPVPVETFAAPVPPAIVEGVVRARGGGPLPFAQVQDVGGAVSAWTDEAGTYRLEGEAGDRWRLRATHPGHEPTVHGVELASAGTISLDFTLVPVPGPSPEPLADFQPFHVFYTLPALLNGDEVAAEIERRYPVDLIDQARGAEAILRLWLDEKGRVVRSMLFASAGDARLDSLARDVSRDMRFRPARNQDEPVRVIVQIPVRFDTEP